MAHKLSVWRSVAFLHGCWYNVGMKRGARILALLMSVLLLGGCTGLTVVAPSASPTLAPTATVNATAVDLTVELAPTAQVVTAEPLCSPSPSPTPIPTPTQEPKPLAGYIIGVDPGHQYKYDPVQEAVAPGSSTTKNRVSGGTRGIVSRVYEYEVNLDVGLLLRDLLTAGGATVVMTRTENDVKISNKERAELFNLYEVDLGIRLHCNGSDNHDKRGCFMLVPTEGRTTHFAENVRLAECIIAAYTEATGLSMAYEGGITYRSDQTGFNWCTRPIVNIEMGHLTNAEEDALLTSAGFQARMAQGIYNGIVAYFAAAEQG